MPLAAFGDDDGAPASTISPALQEALEVREAVDAANEEARDEAPEAVGNTCKAGTMDVEGIGDACVTDDGLFRVVQADGRSLTTHGLDAPPTGAASFPPASQGAVNGASVADITCAAADQPRYVLVYARPGNAADRSATIAPKLRSEVYKVSAFVDSESRSVDPRAGRRLPMRCDGGEPTVLSVSLSGLGGSASFGQVVDALRTQGYEFNGDGSGLERYVVYYDAPSSNGAAGTGHIFTGYDSGDAGNPNNKGGLYAVEYRYDGGGGVPHWEVLIHEIVHTMGAVVASAPGANGNGHCNDGQDIMCYDDGSAGANYTSSACGTKVLDCGRDSYFNPAPAAGSYLASHWNAAATYNRWLVARQSGDTSAPTSPSGLVQTGASSSAVGVSWSPSSDDTGVTGYTVELGNGDGTWRTVVTTARRTAAIGGLSPMQSYQVRVTARDAVGNASVATTLAVATNDQEDRTPPSAPGAVTATVAGSKVTFTWNEAGDNVGVATYELRRLTPSKSNPRTRIPRSAGRTVETTMSIAATGFTPGTAHEFEIVARDHAGNVSKGARRTIRVAKDTKKPTAPTGLRAAGTTSSTTTLSWAAAKDNVGIHRYLVYQRVGSRWVQLRTSPLTSSKRALRITRLRPHTSYSFRVVARDKAGNASAASRSVRVRTR